MSPWQRTVDGTTAENKQEPLEKTKRHRDRHELNKQWLKACLDSLKTKTTKESRRNVLQWLQKCHKSLNGKSYQAGPSISLRTWLVNSWIKFEKEHPEEFMGDVASWLEISLKHMELRGPKTRALTPEEWLEASVQAIQNLLNSEANLKLPGSSSMVLYEGEVSHFAEDLKKWKERYTLKVITLWKVLKAKRSRFLSSSEKENTQAFVVPPKEFPVYLWQPFLRHNYYCFPDSEAQKQFSTMLNDCIRHLNHEKPPRNNSLPLIHRNQVGSSSSRDFNRGFMSLWQRTVDNTTVENTQEPLEKMKRHRDRHELNKQWLKACLQNLKTKTTKESRRNVLQWLQKCCKSLNEKSYQPGPSVSLRTWLVNSWIKFEKEHPEAFLGDVVNWLEISLKHMEVSRPKTCALTQEECLEASVQAIQNLLNSEANLKVA
ncbi:putative protein Niban [Crotalus adamanteus]|uniref:Uncharacterized protein n=1 Tax=Crotalus adamanteus TaxID=8729 RepID=A0AAW1BPN7_CROAD